MPTEKQTQANRANAQKSTGPRTEEGKARSSANALKWGIYAKSEIILGEDLADREAIEAAYFERWKPATPEELFEVRTLIRCDFEDTRLARADAQLWGFSMSNAYGLEEKTALGQGFCLKDTVFARLGRRRDIIRRTYRDALHELERLQSLPAPPDPSPEPEPPAVPAPERAPEPSPAPPAQPQQTKSQTPELASFRSVVLAPPKTSLPHPRPGHPAIEDCPNCRNLGYPSPSCHYVLKKEEES